MKYKLQPTAKFKKDLKVIAKRGYDMSLLSKVLQKLMNDEKLDSKYKDHSLKGEYNNCRECHITPDWLLVYEKDENEIILYLTRTGTHSDLF